MGVPLSDAGSVASIIGVFVAVGLVWWVYRIDQKRRGREESHFKNLTEESLQEILQIFTTVVRKSKSESMTNEENEEITLELEEYFKENYRRIHDLMRDANIYLREWKSSKPEQKAHVKKVIDSLKWLVETFYPLDKPTMVRSKRW